MTDEQELGKVRENLTTWLEAFNEKDIDKLFSLYDEESVYANAGAALMTGKENIKGWYLEAFKMVEGTLLYKEETACQEGGLALLVGKYFFQPPQGSESSADAHLTGRVALVYRKAADGRWLLLFDMDNMPPDVTPSDFV